MKYQASQSFLFEDQVHPNCFVHRGYIMDERIHLVMALQKYSCNH